MEMGTCLYCWYSLYIKFAHSRLDLVSYMAADEAKGANILEKWFEEQDGLNVLTVPGIDSLRVSSIKGNQVFFTHEGLELYCFFPWIHTSI